jgi:hypothetical protein
MTRYSDPKNELVSKRIFGERPALSEVRVHEIPKAAGLK